MLPSALQMARFHAAKPPAAVQMIKRSVNALAGASDQVIMHMGSDQNLFAGAMADAREARDGYGSKRTPTFTGE